MSKQLPAERLVTALSDEYRGLDYARITLAGLRDILYRRDLTESRTTVRTKWDWLSAKGYLQGSVRGATLDLATMRGDYRIVPPSSPTETAEEAGQ